MSIATETILIERLAGGGFNVRVGGRDTERLTFDEMLGVVAALTMPADHKDRVSRWLRSAEEREAEEQRRDLRRRIREQPALTDLRGL